MTNTLRPPPERNDREQTDEEQRAEENARVEVDAQTEASLEDQEGPELGDIGSLED